jgi:hypothetical protein
MDHFIHIWQSSFRIVRQQLPNEQISETYVGRIAAVIERNILKQF